MAAERVEVGAARWAPLGKAAARRVIAFLEGRRVLYALHLYRGIDVALVLGGIYWQCSGRLCAGFVQVSRTICTIEAVCTIV